MDRIDTWSICCYGGIHEIVPVGDVTMEQALAQQRCETCRSDTPPITRDQIAGYLPHISPEWEVVEWKAVRRAFRWRNFLRSMLFVNALAYLAEQEGHHPHIIINYNLVVVKLTTHAIGGLSRNDFIMAAKIDGMVLTEATG